MSLVKRTSVLVSAIALVAAATGCGSRIDGSLAQRAAQGQLGQGSAAGAGEASSGQQDVPGQLPSGASSAPSIGPSSSSAGQVSQGTAGAKAGAPAKAGAGVVDNGGATDVGVTSTTIQLGSVQDLSGPIPGLYRGALVATLAYASYINSQGGIFGRQLKVTSADSQTSCTGASSAYTQLAPKSFAIVGSFSLYDNCAADPVSSAKIPVVSSVISDEMLGSRYVYLPLPHRAGAYGNGMFQYYAKKHGADVQKAAMLYVNIPTAAKVAQDELRSAGSAGWKYVYTRAFSATETNFTADIVRMRNAGVKIFETSSMPPSYMANFMQQASQQNWHPQIIYPTGYDATFLPLFGSASQAEGVEGWTSTPLFFGTTDARNIPGVALYQKWMHDTDPKQGLDPFSFQSWVSMALFVDALKSAGPKATRAGLLAELSKMHKFDAGGVLPIVDVAAKQPLLCYVLWTISKGDFVRTDTPPTTYRCDGRLA